MYKTMILSIVWVCNLVSYMKEVVKIEGAEGNVYI
jgi:hypothetical protein